MNVIENEWLPTSVPQVWGCDASNEHGLEKYTWPKLVYGWFQESSFHFHLQFLHLRPQKGHLPWMMAVCPFSCGCSSSEMAQKFRHIKMERARRHRPQIAGRFGTYGCKKITIHPIHPGQAGFDGKKRITISIRWHQNLVPTRWPHDPILALFHTRPDLAFATMGTKKLPMRTKTMARRVWPGQTKILDCTSDVAQRNVPKKIWQIVCQNHRQPYILQEFHPKYTKKTKKLWCFLTASPTLETHGQVVSTICTFFSWREKVNRLHFKEKIGMVQNYRMSQ